MKRLPHFISQHTSFSMKTQFYSILLAVISIPTWHTCNYLLSHFSSQILKIVIVLKIKRVLKATYEMNHHLLQHSIGKLSYKAPTT